MRTALRNFFYPSKDKKIHFFIMDNFRSIVFALVIALLIRAYVIEPFKIPSTSMVPTLRIGDFLFISKFEYGTKLPFSDIVINKKTPVKGDIIVFDKDIRNTGHKTTYIKRVVGVAGDKIAFKDNHIILNGEKQIIQKTGELEYLDRNGIQKADIYQENLGEIIHDIADNPAIQTPDVQEYVIPKGYVAVMGDNRDNSFDSRFWNVPNWGLVKEDAIRGKGLFLFFSWQHFIPKIDRIGNSLIPKKQGE